MPGPVPKPSAQRRRRNKPADGAEVTFGSAGGQVEVPEGDSDWHPIARRWFDSLAKSGQASYYEASDWATAELVAEAMHRLVTAKQMSAQLFQSVLQGTSSLLATEGDRRRLRLELARGPQVDTDEESSVANLSDYMSRVGG